jgi:hypothetical protein
MNVDNLAENGIIAVGQAALSGSGSDGAVGRHFDSSGVQFAFTSRFVAFLERIRNSVAQLIRIVTNLPNTRRDQVVAMHTARTLEQSGRPGRGVVFSFSTVVNLESIRPVCLGALTVNN